MLEIEVELEVCRYARLRGWAERKTIYKGRRGAPDRHFYKDDRVKLIEFKRPGKTKADPQQQREHKRLLEEGGVVVHVIDTIEAGCALFD